MITFHSFKLTLVQSVCLSTNNKGDNDVQLDDMQRSHGIYLIAERNPAKPQQRDRLVKAVRPVTSSNGVPYLQITSVGSHSKSGWERKGRKGKYLLYILTSFVSLLFIQLYMVYSISQQQKCVLNLAKLLISSSTGHFLFYSNFILSFVSTVVLFSPSSS